MRVYFLLTQSGNTLIDHLGYFPKRPKPTEIAELLKTFFSDQVPEGKILDIAVGLFEWNSTTAINSIPERRFFLRSLDIK